MYNGDYILYYNKTLEKYIFGQIIAVTEHIHKEKTYKIKDLMDIANQESYTEINKDTKVELILVEKPVRNDWKPRDVATSQCP